MADEIFSLTRREYNAFIDMKRDYDGGNLRNKAARRRKTTPTRPRSSTSPGFVRRAKAQENAQTNGLLSVKLLGTDGEVTGDAFDIFVFADQATTDYSVDYLLAETAVPITNGRVLKVFKDIDNEWYMLSVINKTSVALAISDPTTGDLLDLSGSQLRASERSLRVISRGTASKVNQIATDSCP